MKNFFNHGWTQLDTDKTEVEAGMFPASVFICVHPWLNSSVCFSPGGGSAVVLQTL